MNSGSSGSKKIVFKKLVLGTQTPVAELAEEVVEQKPEEIAEQQEALQFHGDIFDQFYRPLGATEGEKRLAEIAAEPVSVPTPTRRPSPTEHAARQRELHEYGEALAHQIYQLAQKTREIDLDVYLSAFNVILSSHSCHDGKIILDAANEFFTEHYYTPIRDRGERPEIYHQIIKRVGHTNSERIGKIVKGLDPAGAARKLWDTFHGPFSDKREVIHLTLLDLTEKQVRAVRDEFLLIPYKDLAKQLHVILHRTITDPQQASRRTIGKTEVYEQKRGAAFKSRDDLRALRYILSGRSAAEVALIKRFYLDQSPLEVSESTATIETHIKSKLLPSDAEKALALLDGWTPRREAEEIYKLLHPHTLSGDVEDQLSDPKDSVERDHTQGLGPLLRRFRKRRVWRGKSGVYHRVINSYELVAERIAALSIQRFFKTNEALDELYGFELDPSLFPTLGSFDPRVVATLVYDRLRIGCEIHELTRPLEYLDPRQSLAVQKAYSCLYGEELIDALKRKAPASSNPAEAVLHIERLLSGSARWPLNLDLLASYRGEAEEPMVWEHDYHSSIEDDDVAMKFAELLDHDENEGARDEIVREFLHRLSYEQRSKLERSFYELTDPHVPLLTALREALSSSGYRDTLILLFGKDLRQVVQEIRHDSILLLSLRDMPSEYVQFVREEYSALHHTNLVQHLLENYEQLDEDTLIERLAILLSPEAASLRSLLFGLRKDRPQEAHGIRTYLEVPLIQRIALERSYDLAYPRLRVHLKYGAAKQAISAQLISEYILVLEGIDPGITALILESFDSVDIARLYQILEQNRDDQKTIEECYDLLFPEATLRRSIKDMKVDLDLINELLLHLESFYARTVAEEVHALVEDQTGETLGRSILEMFAAPTPESPNPRIPEDINWMDEMVYQISLAYSRIYSVDLLQALRDRDVPEEQRELVTGRIFGQEVANSARDLFEILKQNKLGNKGTEHAEERLCSYLETRGARHRDRLLRAYNSHWSQIPSYEAILEDVSKYFVSPTVKKRMMTLLLGIQGEKTTGGLTAAIQASQASNANKSQ
jgi:hypothetical protein